MAHDFWIEPSTFRPPAGAPVGLQLKVGEHFTGDALPRDPNLLKRFVVVGPEGETPVAGVDGVLPAGVLAPAKAGLYVVGYESGDTVAEMTQETLAQYIEEEGLESQLSQARLPQDQPAKFPVKDAFSRSAKALLLVPSKTTSKTASEDLPQGYDHRLGLPLELVPLANPHRLSDGEGSALKQPMELPLELLYRGEPLAGVLVMALHRSDPLHPVKASTDSAGQVRLSLDRPGQWLIKAVRIEAMAEGSKAHYQSLWASLTFEIPTSETAQP